MAFEDIDDPGISSVLEKAGLNDLRKFVRFSSETMFPGLETEIQKAKQAGVSEATLMRVIEKRIESAKQAGFTEQEVKAFTEEGVKVPSLKTYPSAAVIHNVNTELQEALERVGEREVGKGVERGVTQEAVPSKSLFERFIAPANSLAIALLQHGPTSPFFGTEETREVVDVPITDPARNIPPVGVVEGVKDVLPESFSKGTPERLSPLERLTGLGHALSFGVLGGIETGTGAAAKVAQTSKTPLKALPAPKAFTVTPEGVVVPPGQPVPSPVNFALRNLPDVPAEISVKPGVAKQLPPEVQSAVERVITEGGGKFRFVEEPLPGELPPWVSFDEPTGGTLILDLDKVTPQNVAKKIDDFHTAAASRSREVPPGVEVVKAEPGKLTVTQNPVKATKEIGRQKRTLEELKEAAKRLSAPSGKGTTKGGRPRTRVRASQVSSAEARIIAANRLAKLQKLPAEKALAQVEKMDELTVRAIAEKELHSFRVAEGITTTKGGRPAGRAKAPTLVRGLPLEKVEAMELNKTFQKKVFSANVAPPPQAPTFSSSELAKLAAGKGFKMQPTLSPQGLPSGYELVGNGGRVERFASLKEVDGFLNTKGDAKVMPVEQHSTFEKAASGEFLTRRDIGNLARQKAYVTKAKVRAMDPEVPIQKEFVDNVESAKIELGPNKPMGVIEGLVDRDEVARAIQKIEASGYKPAVLRTDHDYDVAYFAADSDDVQKALRLRMKLLDKGPRAMNPKDLAFVYKQFGVRAEDVATFVPTSLKPYEIQRRPIEPRVKNYLKTVFKNPELADEAVIINTGQGAEVVIMPTGGARKVGIVDDIDGSFRIPAHRQGVIEAVKKRFKVDADVIRLQDTPEIIYGDRAYFAEYETASKTRQKAKVDELLGMKENQPPIPDRPIGGASPPLETKFVNPISQPQLSGSPLIRAVGFETRKAEAAATEELKQWVRWREEHLVSRLKTPKARQQAMDVVEGTLEPTQVPKEVFQAAHAFRRAMKDIAVRQGTPQWENYATHVTDFEAIFRPFQQHFNSASKLSDLAAQIQLKVGSEAEFLKFKKIFQRATEFSRLPRITQQELRALWDFSDISTQWSSLPKFLRDRLPREVFDPYLIPRQKGKVPYVKDLIVAFDHRIPRAVNSIHFDPILKKWSPIVDALPGPNLPFTEKGYLTTYFERVVLGRPNASTQALSALLDKINKVMGRELMDTQKIQMAVSLARSGFYRGSLGLDSSFVNLTQGINTWAETGQLLGPMFKMVTQRAAVKQYQGFFGEFNQLVRETFPRAGRKLSPLEDKVVRADELLNKVVLSPMAITEYINRGGAFLAGLEDAARLGLSADVALVNAAAKASEVVPNLQMSQQIQHALFKTIPRTQFGTTPATRTPFLTGPLGRLGSVFLTYPTQQIQFLSRGLLESSKASAQHIKALGLVDGFAKGFKTGDSTRLLRFMATTGAFAYLPVALSKIGVDIRNAFGAQGVLGLLTFPFYQFVTNAYNAVLGETPRSRRQARDEFGKFIKTVTIPQYRYGLKTKKIFDNIERGYAVDRRNRYMYDTTPIGELLRLIGVNPEIGFQTRQATRTIAESAMEYGMEKQEAIDLFLDEGDPAGISEFMQKWGRPITQKDIMRTLQGRQTSPAERAGRGLPKELLMRQMMEQGQVPRGR